MFCKFILLFIYVASNSLVKNKQNDCIWSAVLYSAEFFVTFVNYSRLVDKNPGLTSPVWFLTYGMF